MPDLVRENLICEHTDEFDDDSGHGRERKILVARSPHRREAGRCAHIQLGHEDVDRVVRNSPLRGQEFGLESWSMTAYPPACALVMK